jgi:hypothetical protein
MMAGLVEHHSMEQWVTTIDELSAGGRYTSYRRRSAPLPHPLIFHFKRCRQVP